MKSFKKISVIISLFIMQTPLISGPVQDLKDAANRKINDAQEAAQKAIETKATEVDQEVSRTWAQWRIQKLGKEKDNKKK